MQFKKLEPPFDSKYTVISETSSHPRKALVRCECGKELEVFKSSIQTGRSKMCTECSVKNRTTLIDGVALRSHSAYTNWDKMTQRCINPNDDNYSYYGGRGITICEDWLNSEHFIKWAISNGYEDGLTIDREDPNGNYEPDNCRWISQKDQREHKRKQYDNKSGYRGIWYDEIKDKYETAYTFNNKKYILGYFMTVEQSALTRAKKLLDDDIKLTHDITSNQLAILEWGKERNLVNFSIETEIDMVEEELDELSIAKDTNDEYEIVDAYCDIYVIFTQTMAKAGIVNYDVLTNPTLSKYYELYMDIPTIIQQMGYNFDNSLSETIKEIDSRKGEVDNNGKFQKYKDEYHINLWYKAEYIKAVA